jgi:hypothetical protein
VFRQGDSPVSGNKLSVPMPGNPATNVWVLSNGADVITDAIVGDTISLVAAQGSNALSYLASGTVGDQQYTVVRGNYGGSSFVANSSGSDSLVIYDGAGASASYSATLLVLQNVATVHQTNSGAIII